MQFTKINRSNYLLVKIGAYERRYLEKFRKNEHPKTVKNTDKFLSDKLALEIKTLWVMSRSMKLEAKGELATDKVDQIFEELDERIDEYERVVDKYVDFLNRYVSKSNRKMKSKTEIIDVRKLLRHK